MNTVDTQKIKKMRVKINLNPGPQWKSPDSQFQCFFCIMSHIAYKSLTSITKKNVCYVPASVTTGLFFFFFLITPFSVYRIV